MPLGRPTNSGHDTPPWAGQLIELMTAIRDHTRPGEFSELWQPQTHTLPTGHSRQIAQRNLQRRRLVIWTDAGNTSAVWIGAAPFGGADAPRPNDGYVPIAPGSVPLELYTPGDVYAWSSSNGNVCVVQEFGRG